MYIEPCESGILQNGAKAETEASRSHVSGQSGNALFYAQFHLCVFHKEEQKNREREVDGCM